MLFHLLLMLIPKAVLAGTGEGNRTLGVTGQISNHKPRRAREIFRWTKPGRFCCQTFSARRRFLFSVDQFEFAKARRFLKTRWQQTVLGKNSRHVPN
jgi:hypothetical protein